MAFNDTLKDLFDQGLAVSKDMAAKAGEKAQDWGTRGLKASKEFAAKAGAKLQEMGEKGVLKMEISQLERQAKKLISFLGAAAYSLYEQQKPFSAEEPEIENILGQINLLKETMEKKEEELKTRFPSK